jgi:polysaccharide biosynthesis transport protein
LKRDIEQSDAFSLNDILYVVFRRKFLLAALLILAALIFAYAVVSHVDTYKAEAVVMIRRQTPSYAMPAESRQILLREELVNSEIEIIESPAVAEAVVDSLGLAKNGNRLRAVHNLANAIKAVAEPSSYIIKISYTSRDPEKAARVVNAALDAYLKVRSSVTFDASAVEYLDEQATRARAKLDSVGEAIVEHGAQGGQLAPGLLSQQQMGLVNAYNNNLKDLNTKIAMLEKLIVRMENWLASGADVSDAPSEDIAEMTNVRQAKASHVDLLIKLETARAKYTPDHPEVQRLEREVKGSEAIIRQEIREGINREKQLLAEYESQKKATEETLAELHAENERIAEDDMRLRILERELDIRSDLYGVIVDRREQFRITAATDPSLQNVGVVSRASVPVTPSTGGVNMKFVFALFTLVFGTALIFAVERMDQTLVRRVDVEREAGLKVLASIRYRPRG